MKKLFCLAILCFGFVGCSAETVAKPEGETKPMSTPTTPAPTEGTAPAGDAPKDATETPNDPAPVATEAAEVK